MLGMPTHYFYRCTRAKPITAETVDTVAGALLKSKAEQERSIALAEAAADALTPIAHYKKVDSRAARVVMDSLSDVRMSIQRRAPLYGKDFRSVSIAQWGEHFTRVEISLIGDACSVADLMAGLRACEFNRQELARLEQQFTELEEMLEAEEKIREMVREIERTRDAMAQRLLGGGPSYYHEAVRGYMPGLAGRD